MTLHVHNLPPQTKAVVTSLLAEIQQCEQLAAQDMTLPPAPPYPAPSGKGKGKGSTPPSPAADDATRLDLFAQEALISRQIQKALCSELSQLDGIGTIKACALVGAQILLSSDYLLVASPYKGAAKRALSRQWSNSPRHLLNMWDETMILLDNDPGALLEVLQAASNGWLLVPTVDPAKEYQKYRIFNKQDIVTLRSWRASWKPKQTTMEKWARWSTVSTKRKQAP